MEHKTITQRLNHTHLQVAQANAKPKLAKEYGFPTLTDKQNEKSTCANKQFGNMAVEVLLLGGSARLNGSNSIELLC